MTPKYSTPIHTARLCFHYVAVSTCVSSATLAPHIPRIVMVGLSRMSPIVRMCDVYVRMPWGGGGGDRGRKREGYIDTSSDTRLPNRPIDLLPTSKTPLCSIH